MRAANQSHNSDSSRLGSEPDHVLHHKFGLTEKDNGEELQALIDEVEPDNTLHAKILQMEAYDTQYGIADYDNIEIDCLSHVRMHPKEDPSVDSLLYDTIRKFGERDVGEIFKISLLDFLDLPLDYCEKLMEIALDIKKAKNKRLSGLNEELENQLK